MDCLLVVEDAPSEAVLRRLVGLAGNKLNVTDVIRAGGFGQIKSRIANFRNACHVVPHIVMTDLDAYPCPPDLLKDWKVGELPDRMLMRVAVREVESWLLADRDGIAKTQSRGPRFPARLLVGPSFFHPVDSRSGRCVFDQPPTKRGTGHPLHSPV